MIDLATLRQVQAASSGESLSAAAVRERAISHDDAVRGRQRREFGRVNVPLEKGSAPHGQSRLRLVAAVIVVLIAILGAGVLAGRWWSGNAPVDGGKSANASAAASPGPVASPSPSPTPSPTPVPKPARKPEPKKEEKPSKLKSILNKAKRILKP